MKGMLLYYVSRTLLSIGIGVFVISTGSPWWLAGLVGMIVLALFLWAPHSGRYAVFPEYGITALRHDERTQAINDKAARNAFIASGLLTAGSVIHFSTFTPTSVPVGVLRLILVLGLLVYYVSDLRLRRKSA